MNRRSTALATASGLLLVVAFPTLNLHLLAWIALVPLFFALSGQSVEERFLARRDHRDRIFRRHRPLGHELSALLRRHSAHPGVAHHAAPLRLSGALSRALRRRCCTSQEVLILRSSFSSRACLWTALELARTYVFSGFPWSLLGYSQYLALPVIQVADITGVYGVSFLIVLVNAAIAEFIMDRKKYPRPCYCCSHLVLVLGYGLMQPSRPGEHRRYHGLRGAGEHRTGQEVGPSLPDGSARCLYATHAGSAAGSIPIS